MIVVDSSALVDLLVRNEPAATFVRERVERADALANRAVDERGSNLPTA